MGMILLSALLVRLPNLWGYGLRQDAFQHYEAAIGYLKTGTFVQWDFLKSEPGREYPRAWLYTWQVAQVFKHWGVSIGNGRVVSLVWGMLIFAPLYGLTRKLRMDEGETLLLMMWVALSPHFITISRWIRMYTMFDVLFLVLALSLFCWLNVSVRRPGEVVLWGGTTVGLGILSFHIHELTMTLLPSVAVWMGWEWLYHRQNHEDLCWSRLFPWLIAAALSGVALLFLWKPGVMAHNLRTSFHPFYVLYLFQETLGFSIGGMTLALALIYCRKTRFERFLVCVVYVPILFFVFFTNRYPMYRYLSHLILIASPLFIIALKRFFADMEIDRIVVPVAGCVLIAVVLALPAEDLPSKLRYIRAGNMGYLHFPGTENGRHEAVIRRVGPLLKEGDYVGFYYWKHSTYYLAQFGRPGVTVERYPREDFLTVEDLRRIERHHDRVWIIYREWMLRDLPPETERYLERHYRRVLPRKRYHMNVFLRSSGPEN